MTRSIALIGPMAAGKTTIANALRDGFGYRHLSMIGAFRDLFAEAYPGVAKGDPIEVIGEVPSRTTYSQGVKPIHRSLTGRGLMQMYGAATRSVDRDFWPRVAFARAADLLADGVPHTTDDVRFPNEAALARENGFLIVRVETPRDVRRERYVKAYGRPFTEREENDYTERSIATIRADMTVDGTRDPVTLAHELASLDGPAPTPILKEDHD